MMDFKQLKARFEETRQYKDRWLALYKDLYSYVIPDRDAFNVKWNYTDVGKPVTVQIWDTTAMLAAYERANDLHALLIPKDRTWGKFDFDKRTKQNDNSDALKPVLDEINDNISWFLNESNLSRAISASNLDLVGGTGALWVESISDDYPLCFTAIPAVALYIEYSSDDVLNTCWYQCKMSGRKVIETFPKYRGTGLEGLRSSPDDPVIVLYGQIKLAEDKFYLYATLQDIDPFTPLWEVDRSYNQIIIYRDRVRPGESEGRGIGIDLLPSIVDLNRLVRDDRKSQAFKANPPMFYDNNIYFNPHAVRQWAGTWFARTPGGRNPVEALEMPTYPDTIEHIRDMRDYIRKGFQVDPLGEINTPVKSATEVSIRENRAQRSSTTDISRLINEGPKQIYEISAKILAERRLLSHNRDVYGINIKRMKFVFQSPLYDLQKQDDLAHFVTNLQVKQQFMGEGPAMATLNLAEANDFLTEKLNLPRKLFVTAEVLNKYVKQAAQMQQQQMQQSQLPSPSTSAGQVNFPQQSQVQI